MTKLIPTQTPNIQHFFSFSEYGATAAFFPPDDASMSYLEQTSRDLNTIEAIDTYLKASKMKRNYNDEDQDPVFSTVVELDLATVVPSCSGKSTICYCNLKPW